MMRFLFTGLGGVNIMQMLEDASIEGGPESGKILLDFNDAMGDRIQVFVEWWRMNLLIEQQLSPFFVTQSKLLCSQTLWCQFYLEHLKDKTDLDVYFLVELSWVRLPLKQQMNKYHAFNDPNHALGQLINSCGLSSF